MTADALRKKHPRFTYRSARWTHENEVLTIDFEFLLEPEIVFRPMLTLQPVTAEQIERVGPARLNAWVFHLGLIELFSYWKATASPEIEIEAGYLNDDQLAWWKNVLLKSMGEFFYTNDIDFTQPDFVKFVCTAEQSPSVVSDQADISFPRPFLVPVGGGKDSALTLELLEENGLDYDILLSHPQSPAAGKIAELSRAKNIITLHREFDPQLFELNQAGYLNGHTPFSARLAFETSLAGLLLGHQRILVANEYSANEGNVPFLGTTVNHQWSKTFEFEELFRQYVNEYLSPAPEYLSVLRPINELQIAGIFSQFPRYHALFKSCNRKQQQDAWCCECAKCLFVFAVLSPFVPENELVGTIFPKNVFENSALNLLALALLGKDKHKPFECVGTYDETLAAFYLSLEAFEKNHPGEALPPVLAFVKNAVLDQEPNLSARAQEALRFWNPRHNLDHDLEALVKGATERIRL